MSVITRAERKAIVKPVRAIIAASGPLSSAELADRLGEPHQQVLTAILAQNELPGAHVRFVLAERPERLPSGETDYLVRLEEIEEARQRQERWLRGGAE